MGTTDRAVAERRKAKLVAHLAKGGSIETAADAAAAPDTVAEVFDRYIHKRKAKVMARDEAAYFQHHVRRAIGPLRVVDVTARHIQDLLDADAVAGTSTTTISHIRAMLFRVFKMAKRDGMRSASLRPARCFPFNVGHALDSFERPEESPTPSACVGSSSARASSGTSEPGRPTHRSAS